MRDIYQGRYQIAFDGNTVWVNTAEGICVARFGRGGIDIHKDYEAQMAGGPQCLHCTHGRPGIEEWNDFIIKMKAIYGVAIPEEARGVWIR